MGFTSILPETPLLLYMYVRKEALLLSQIEVTQSRLSDLLLFESEEAPGVPPDDVQEVSNDVAAMNHGLDRIREGLPLSLRLIREIHAILLEKERANCALHTDHPSGGCCGPVERRSGGCPSGLDQAPSAPLDHPARPAGAPGNQSSGAPA